MVLKKFGYQVLWAADGQEAVDTFVANRDQIGLILMDIIMPHKNGVEAVAEIKQLQPEVTVPFISGYSSECYRAVGWKRWENRS